MDFSNRMNTAESGAYLGKSRYWMQTHWRSEGIPCYRIGGQYFFLKEDLDTYVTSKRIEPRRCKKSQGSSRVIEKVRLAS